jgi:hypothetical protein
VIYDHARITVTAHLAECKWTADQVAGKALPAFGIGDLAANAVLQRSTAVVLRQVLHQTNQLIKVNAAETCGSFA